MKKKIDSKFDGTPTTVSVFQRDGALIVRVDFSSHLYAPCLAMEMDTAGNVLDYYSGISNEGPSRQIVA